MALKAKSEDWTFSELGQKEVFWISSVPFTATPLSFCRLGNGTDYSKVTEVCEIHGSSGTVEMV